MAKFLVSQSVSQSDVIFSENDNLIIKGNNLIALASLLKRYEGKVKCIYIDPPYNTGNDSFGYNDRFNHSTWLTFMKNRLELAKRLLSDDGVIFVQCDDNEQAYLKVLMDGNFGRENHINMISVNTKLSAGASGGGEDKRLKKNLEYILIYSKNTDTFRIFNPVYKRTELMSYIRAMKENNKSFKYTSVLYRIENREYYTTIKDGSGDDIVIEKINNYELKSVKQVAQLEKISEREVYEKYYDRIMTTTNAQTSIRTRVWEATDSENNMYIATYIPKTGKDKFKLKELIFMGKQKVLVIWLKDTTEWIKNKIYKKEIIGTYWDGFSWINVNKEGNAQFSNAKKPEHLINRIIEMATSKGDLVLDFHLGSGTTAAVAHKMGRRYIGIEQMDYIEDIAVERLKKVIDGEQTGISKIVNWQGGGSFVYCELKENGQKLIDSVLSSDGESIDEIKEKIFSDDRIVPYITKQELEKVDKDFLNLKLEEKKKILMDLVDKNKLYINYSDIDNEEYDISKEEKQFNNSFYKDVK